MTYWEVDVELRVRKTLSFGGPLTEDAARQVARMALTGSIDMSAFQKWTDGRSAYRPTPVETIIDNDPRSSRFANFRRLRRHDAPQRLGR